MVQLAPSGAATLSIRRVSAHSEKSTKDFGSLPVLYSTAMMRTRSVSVVRATSRLPLGVAIVGGGGAGRGEDGGGGEDVADDGVHVAGGGRRGLGVAAADAGALFEVEEAACCAAGEAVDHGLPAAFDDIPADATFKGDKLGPAGGSPGR